PVPVICPPVPVVVVPPVPAPVPPLPVPVVVVPPVPVPVVVVPPVPVALVLPPVPVVVPPVPEPSEPPPQPGVRSANASAPQPLIVKRNFLVMVSRIRYPQTRLTGGIWAAANVRLSKNLFEQLPL